MSVSDDAKRLEKAFVKEAKADDKQVSGAIKHLKAAEKAETKAHKVRSRTLYSSPPPIQLRYF